MSDPAKRIILFVDDDEDDFLVLKDIFKECRPDLQLEWAKDGEEAIDYLTQRGSFRASPRPAVILLDLNMPKLNGDEVLKQIRAHEELRSIPVVVLSNSMNKKDAVETYHFGGNSFVRKPAGYKELREFVQVFSKYWFDCSVLV